MDQREEPRDYIHDFARRAAGGKVKGHPTDLIELADRIADVRRGYEGGVTNADRNLLADGLPVGALTGRDGKSIVTRGEYRLQAAA